MEFKKSALIGFVTATACTSPLLTASLSIAAEPVKLERATWQAAYASGQALLAAQQRDSAEEEFRLAFKLVKSESKNSDDYENCMLKLADTLSLRDKANEARQLYLNLLELRTRKYGGSSSKLVPMLFALGSIQEAEGDHATAMSYYQRALRINEKGYGPYSPALVENLHRMGRVSQRLNHKDDSAKHYKRAMAILLKDPGLSSSSEMETLMHDYSDLLKGNDESNRDLITDFQTDILGKGQNQSANAATAAGASSALSGTKNTTVDKDYWKKMGSTESSISSLPRINPEPVNSAVPPSNLKAKQSSFNQQSIASLTQEKAAQTNEDPAITLRGIERPSSVQSLDPAYKVINNALFNQSHYKRGVDYYERMIASDIDALGPNHPSVANDLTGLAQIYIAQGKYSEAEQLLNRAVPIYQKAYGEANVLTINSMASLASAEFQLGKIDKAADNYRKALANGQSTLGPNSMEVARILNELAYLNYNQGKLAEARTLYEWAVSSTQVAAGENSPLFAACLKDYAQVLRSLGELGPAASAESRAERIMANAKTN